MLLLGLDDIIMKDYLSSMVNVSILFGENRTTAERDFSEVLQFEMRLANVSLLPGIPR